jgi:hypothetical protein
VGGQVENPISGSEKNREYSEINATQRIEQTEMIHIKPQKRGKTTKQKEINVHNNFHGHLICCNKVRMNLLMPS